MEPIEGKNFSLSLGGSIYLLGLSKRTSNALIRAKIFTIEQLIQKINSGDIFSVWQFGEKAYDEVLTILRQNNLYPLKGLTDPQNHRAIDGSIGPHVNHSIGKDRFWLDILLKRQLGTLEKFISLGLIHEEAVVNGKMISDWINYLEKLEPLEGNFLLAYILHSPNITDELTFFLNPLSLTQVELLIKRYGFNPITFTSIGIEYKITRQRVEQKVKASVETLVKQIRSYNSNFFDISFYHSPSLIKIQTCILLGRDLGPNISYNIWRELLFSRGLIGSWRIKELVAVDPIEAMISVCKIASEAGISELNIPENIHYSIQLLHTAYSGEIVH